MRALSRPSPQKKGKIEIENTLFTSFHHYTYADDGSCRSLQNIQRYSSGRVTSDVCELRGLHRRDLFFCAHDLVQAHIISGHS